MMRPFSRLTPFDEAKRILVSSVGQITRAENVQLSEGGGRILAEDVLSQTDVPPFYRSAMDGFAVKAKDTFSAGKFEPVELRVIGKSLAGRPSASVLGERECIQIATGAKLPAGADAIVKVENTEGTEKAIRVFSPVHPGQDVSKKGEDIKTGQRVLKAGAYLDPSNLGVLAALGLDTIGVFQKPSVAIIPTGAEVAPPGEELRDGQVFDINTYTLSQVALVNGCLPKPWNIVADEYEELERALRDALSEDMIVFSGGSSVGETDVLVDIITELGEVLFHGIQVKPGKPTLCGKIEDRLIVGMPGFPAACLTNAYTLLAPALRTMARFPPATEHTLDVPVSRRIVSSLGRHHIITVRIGSDEAEPVYKESGAITSLADADGYMEIPVGTELIEKGEIVRVTLFRPV